MVLFNTKFSFVKVSFAYLLPMTTAAALLLLLFVALPAPAVDAAAAAVAAAITVSDLKLNGSCSFNNQWTGSPSCMEFRGDEGLWTSDSMTERCDFEAESSFSEEACPTITSSELAGWCITNIVYLSAVAEEEDDVAVAIEASSMMITDMAPDCSTNKMACETFIGGMFEAAADATAAGCSDGGDGSDAVVASTAQEEVQEADPFSVVVETTTTTTTTTTTQSMCDESLTAPVSLPCPDPTQLRMAYNGSYVDCGSIISVEDASMVPTIRVDNINIFDSIIDDPDNNALYTLILVDTSDTPVHPILHYGAVNIPGLLLLNGFALDNNDNNNDNSNSDGDGDNGINIFSNYRGPNPPKSDDFWSTPATQKTLFVYEYMLSLQPNKIEMDDDNESEPISTMGFDYEKFFEETIGITSSFDNNSNNIMSTYFLSGRCVNGVEAAAATGEDSSDNTMTTETTDILIESFDSPKYLWESIIDMMDENKMNELGSMEEMYNFNYSNFDNEFNTNNGDNNYDSSNWRNEYYDSIAGSSMKIDDGIMILTAIISDNMNTGGGDMMRTGMVNMNARGVFPDLSTCNGFKLIIKLTTQQPDDDDGEKAAALPVVYDGYKIEFGYKKLPDSVFGFGYRANLTIPIINESNVDDTTSGSSVSSISRQADNNNGNDNMSSSSFTTVIIPFDDFTLDWDWNNGKVVTPCSKDDQQYCPDEITLQDIETISITAVGSTHGIVQQLHIKSIYGTGCDVDYDATTSTTTDNTPQLDEDAVQWTCSSDADSFYSSDNNNNNDEIVIESFSDPSLDWFIQNDPVMGGESYSSITMMTETDNNNNGTAFFTGEVKDVPFLGRKYKQK
jgi:hypothetical protein